jgi:hypothetical protein
MGRTSTPQLVTDAATAARIGDARFHAVGRKCDSCGGVDPVFYVGQPGMCVDCLARAWQAEVPDDHPRGRRACLIAGLDYWVDQIPRLCAKAPHGLRHHPLTNRCIACEAERERRRAEGRAVATHRVGVRRRSIPAPRMPRADARALGFTRYMPEERCGRDHMAPRYVSTGGCIACLAGLAPGTNMESFGDIDG